MKSVFGLFLSALGVNMVLSGDASSEGLIAKFETSKGSININLYPEKAPITVSNFVNLVERGYYNGLVFHRVIKDFMVQGGDPDGVGSGGPGYEFEDEFDASLTHNGPGILSMANRGPRTNGSQFFITHLETPWLDGKHTIFGKVSQGLDVVNMIAQGDVIKKVTITGDSKALLEKYSTRVSEWNSILDKKYPKK
jgi:peptidyl-prolyl cis-trans isomerase B (cyclophilin B)